MAYLRTKMTKQDIIQRHIESKVVRITGAGGGHAIKLWNVDDGKQRLVRKTERELIDWHQQGASGRYWRGDGGPARKTNIKRDRGL